MKLSSLFATATSTFAVTVIAAFSFSSQALGQTFLGESRGIWGEPLPGGTTNSQNTPTFTGVGTNSFTWGKPEPDGTRANQLTFTGNSFSADIDSVFKIGDLEYFNGTVVGGTTVDSVPLNLSLLFTSPTNFAEVFKFDLALVNTPNTGTPEENADSVIAENNFSDRSFSFEDNTYLLELIGFSRDGAQTTVNEFRVLEGEQTTAGIYARITQVTSPEKIPEPANIVGLSVLGIYLFSRKNKSLRKKIN